MRMTDRGFKRFCEDEDLLIGESSYMRCPYELLISEGTSDNREVIILSPEKAHKVKVAIEEYLENLTHWCGECPECKGFAE